MCTGMHVALTILHILMAQVGGDPKGIVPLASEVEAAAMSEDMGVEWEGKSRRVGPSSVRGD